MVKMSMRDKNIIDFFGIKIKCSFVNFFCVFTLVHSAFDKKFEVVTLHTKTGTCNCPCTTKKFEFQVKMPLLLPVASFKNLNEMNSLHQKKIYMKSFYLFASFSVFLKHDKEIWRKSRETGFSRCPAIGFLRQTDT